jgi:hypothetical protein
VRGGKTGLGNLISIGNKRKSSEGSRACKIILGCNLCLEGSFGIPEVPLSCKKGSFSVRGGKTGLGNLISIGNKRKSSEGSRACKTILGCNLCLEGSFGIPEVPLSCKKGSFSVRGGKTGLGNLIPVRDLLYLLTSDFLA